MQWLHAHQGLQSDLEVLHVGRAPLVQQDEIEAEPLGAQIFAGFRQLACEPELLCIRDTHQDDRQVARNAERPETGLAARAFDQRVG